MEIQLIILIFLIILGIADLSVGVANDAVNFTNAAMGSKVTKFRVVMIVAGFGILMGTLFAGGMMEIAKKGIFNPQFFTFPEIMLIYLTAIVGNVLLIDLFNTYGLPTSTTVAIVACLLGAALGISFFKVTNSNLQITEIIQYINVAKVSAIFISIILSIIFAFVFGFIAQYITRLVFSFNYQKNLKKYGAIWASISVTFISYFVFLKGIKKAPFVTPDLINYINSNLSLILIIFALILFIVFQILFLFTKVNVLKFTVLYGTFALAMAFSANDLVNFIGVPLGGLDAYMLAIKNPDPLNMLMIEFTKSDMPVSTPLLLFAGLIMFLTLFYSKKARSVTKTELSLGRQEEGYERFQPNALARLLVGASLTVVDFLKKVTPESIQSHVRNQFDTSNFRSDADENGESKSFDLLRAVVIMMISSALISLGTSMKLPLSTTYITFIAAMAAALPDKAWGRESAVYRVSGVITVVGGWFLTAVFATIISFLLALLFAYTKNFAVFISLIIVVAVYLQSTILHRKRMKKEDRLEKAYVMTSQNIDSSYYRELLNQIGNYVSKIYSTVSLSLDRLINRDTLKLRKYRYDARDTSREVSILSINMINLLKVPESIVNEFVNYSTKIMANLQNLADRVLLLTEQNYYYVANSHHQLTEEQIEEVKVIINYLNTLGEDLINTINNVQQYKETDIEAKIDEFRNKIELFTKEQLKRVKDAPKPIKRNLLYFTILSDMDLIADNTKALYKSLRKVFKQIKKEEKLTSDKSVQENNNQDTNQ